MLLWPLNATTSRMRTGGRISSLDLLNFASQLASENWRLDCVNPTFRLPLAAGASSRNLTFAFNLRSILYVVNVPHPPRPHDDTSPNVRTFYFSCHPFHLFSLLTPKLWIVFRMVIQPIKTGLCNVMYIVRFNNDLKSYTLYRETHTLWRWLAFGYTLHG